MKKKKKSKRNNKKKYEKDRWIWNRNKSDIWIENKSNRIC